MAISINKLKIGDTVYFEMTQKQPITNMRGRHLTKRVRFPATVTEVDKEKGAVTVSSFRLHRGSARYSASGTSIAKLFWGDLK